MRLLATDLDGTLETSGGVLKQEEVQLLQKAGEMGLKRVLLTGRNYYSLNRIIRRDDPFDYICFSSGTGIVHWPEGNLLKASSMDPKEAERAESLLLKGEYSFFRLYPIPENQRFTCYQGKHPAEDFFRRQEKYRQWEAEKPAASPSQFLVILQEEQERENLIELLNRSMPTLSLIRATSPMDGKSPWLEIFAPGVDKGSALSWICRQLGIKASETAALGNDWNDLHMLEWAGVARVVHNSPEALKEQFGSLGEKASALSEFLALLDIIER